MFIEQLATFLENEVKNRLEAGLDRDDQNIRHKGIIPCFTEADNVILCDEKKDPKRMTVSGT